DGVAQRAADKATDNQARRPVVATAVIAIVAASIDAIVRREPTRTIALVSRVIAVSLVIAVTRIRPIIVITAIVALMITPVAPIALLIITVVAIGSAIIVIVLRPGWRVRLHARERYGERHQRRREDKLTHEDISVGIPIGARPPKRAE